MDEFKTEEDSQEKKGLIVSMPISSDSNLTRSSSRVASGEALNFFQCLPSDPEAMAAGHHMSSLLGCFEQLMNTVLGVSAEIERIKAGVSAGLEKASFPRIDYHQRQLILMNPSKKTNRNASDNSGEQGKEHALPSKKQDGGDAEEDNRNASDHPGEQGNEHALPSKKQDGGDAEEDNRNASDHPGEQGNEHALPSNKQDGGDAEEDNRNASDHPGEQGNEHALPSNKQDGGDAEEDNRNASDHSGEQGREHALPRKKQEGGDAEENVFLTLSLSLRITKPLIPSSMADEDNAQIDQEIQNLVKKLDVCVAKFDQKRQVLQKANESETEALRKDQRETRELSNIEAGSRKIANVKQWLNQMALISGDTSGEHDQGNNYSVLVVDDDRNARDTIQRYTMPVGTEKHRAMEFQEAKNGKEAVYLHLAGASFVLIIMDDQMPIKTGIQATQLLRKMGVKSQIVGVTSESDQQAFIHAGLNTCIRKPRSLA
ncbi:PREDICTED: oxidative stress response two-component system protein SSK1-like [Populus euphratica]|uniref:Oxidative stress response two-component system protein SSK1-like n=1 Tax=Populus euphratica TaxID=75702 RepID=A0AAJ6XJI1_POPEU|nr:PREDICTED: oxidative stress response two-component system protein SSK1-like [Populus euphratica]